MSRNLSSAAVAIGDLRVNYYFGKSLKGCRPKRNATKSHIYFGSTLFPMMTHHYVAFCAKLQTLVMTSKNIFSTIDLHFTTFRIHGNKSSDK